MVSSTSLVDLEAPKADHDSISKSVTDVLDDVPLKIPKKYADESYKLFQSLQEEVPAPTAEEAARIKRKITWVVIPFLCMGYHLMYVDKQILGSQSILGLFDDTGIGQNQYNWLVSIFYFGYGIAEFPQAWALQRFPVGRYLAVSLLIWTLLILAQIGCHNFAGLFVLRFLLGLCEACVVPAFLITLSMFYTHDEQATMMPIMWAAGNSSPITSGLLSYGVLHINTPGFSSWKWFSVISGLWTLVFAVAVWIWFPDSPINAKFLTPKERAQAILRIQSNHEGIEQKMFKRYQFIEALKDPKSYMFALHSWTQEMANGTASMYSILIKGFGFTTDQTTLLGCVNGATALVSLGAAAVIMAKTKNSRGWISIWSYLLPIASCIMLIAVPFKYKWVLVAAIWIRAPGGIPYAIVMNWGSTATSGHTKKVTVNAMYHIGYALGNILSPQLFQNKYKPRYLVSWWVILWLASVFPMILVAYIRFYLARENKRRDRLAAEKGQIDRGVVWEVNERGEKVAKTVSDTQLDLTDRENLAFRYPL